MKWFRWLRRAVSILFWLATCIIVAWIFWPSAEPSERDLLRLVPSDATAIFVQRDLGQLWPAFKQTAFFRSLQNSSLMPVKVEGSSLSQRMAEQALLDLVGKRVVCFAM